MVIQLNDIARTHQLLTIEALTVALCAGVTPWKVGNTRVVSRSDYESRIVPVLERFLATKAGLERVVANNRKEGAHVGAVK